LPDGYANHRVIVFDAATGVYKRHWGAYGNPPGGRAGQHWTRTGRLRRSYGNPVHCIPRLPGTGSFWWCDRSHNANAGCFRKDGTLCAEISVLKGQCAPAP